MSRPEFVQSLERGLSVIRCFDAENARLTLAEVAQRTGLTRATARRLLLTLGDLGYVSANGRHFSLTPPRARHRLRLPVVAEHPADRPAVPRGPVRARERVGVGDGARRADIIYVARVPTKRIMTISLGLGSRLPAYCTSMGRVLLAELTPAELAAIVPERLEPRTEHTMATAPSSRTCSPTSAGRGGPGRRGARGGPPVAGRRPARRLGSRWRP